MNERLRPGVDGNVRCWWCGDDPLYVAYHDNEWGRPVREADRLFEKLCLEGFQSGLAWITVLRKRENFREAFNGFGIDAVARMNAAREENVTALLGNAGIIRHRGKIEATLDNALRAVEMRDAGIDLVEHVWSFAATSAYGRTDGPLGTGDMNTTSSAATALSKDLKKRGWRFVGPTTVYSFMQSMGLVNDHIDGCHVIDACEKERRSAARGAGGRSR